MHEDLITWAEIDLDAIADNVRAMQRHVGDRVGIFAVVKANAYGHGAVQVARAALEAGAARLAVHRAIEGAALRRAGIEAPILVMGYTPPAAADLVARWRLTPALITTEFAQALSTLGQANGRPIPVHIKVDTGMSRFGLQPDEVVDFATQIRRLPGLEIEGIFTHFATADAADPFYALKQLETFNQVLDAVHEAGISTPLVHAANSAAAMKLPRAHFDGVRMGIAMYGLRPSDEWPPVFALHPALALKGHVGRIRVLPAGAGIGYGRTYVTQHPTRVALVQVGYGDGFHRILSNQGQVLIHGRRAPIVGRVSMDQIVIDVDSIPDVRQDEEVVLIGKQGDAELNAEEVARLAGTINYEVTTSLLPRVTRVYLRGGQVVEIAQI